MLRPIIKSNEFGSRLTHFLFILLLLAASGTLALAQTAAWSKQSSGTLAWLHSIFFLDVNRGWVVGSRGTLLSTNDGGKSWQPRPRPTEDVIRDIQFLDEVNGWLVCERNIYDLKGKEEPRSYLMKTTDGGDNWSRVEVIGVDHNARLTRVIFNEAGYAWAFGEGGAIYATRDNGASWTKLQLPTRHLLLGGTFVDNYRGWVVGAGATILQTSDGGDTWHQSRLSGANGTRFNATCFIDNRVGWAVGSNGTIFRTVNGGRTWAQQDSTVDADLLDVKFIDVLEGWAVGSDGTVIYTNNGGLQWTRQRSETTHPLERIFFADRTHGWAVGFGGTIVTHVRAEAPKMLR